MKNIYLLTIVLLSSFAAIDAVAQDRSVEGVVTAINTTKNSITVRSNETRRLNTYFMDEKTKIQVGDKMIPLSRVKKGQTVALRYRATDSGREVVSFAIANPDMLIDIIQYRLDSEGIISGEITGIRLAKRTITLKDDITGERLSFILADNAAITRDRRPIRLRDLSKGDHIAGSYMFTEEGLIFVTAKAPQAKAAPTPASVVAEVKPEVVAAPIAMLPKTASNQYVVLFLALVLLVGAASVRMFRVQLSRNNAR